MRGRADGGRVRGETREPRGTALTGQPTPSGCLSSPPRPALGGAPLERLVTPLRDRKGGGIAARRPACSPPYARPRVTCLGETLPSSVGARVRPRGRPEPRMSTSDTVSG